VKEIDVVFVRPKRTRTEVSKASCVELLRPLARLTLTIFRITCIRSVLNSRFPMFRSVFSFLINFCFVGLFTKRLKSWSMHRGFNRRTDDSALWLHWLIAISCWRINYVSYSMWWTCVSTNRRSISPIDLTWAWNSWNFIDTSTSSITHRSSTNGTLSGKNNSDAVVSCCCLSYHASQKIDHTHTVTLSTGYGMNYSRRRKKD
jgi:hypothetical protein